MVSSVDKKLDVKPRFLEIFQEENYPTEFPYKSKVPLVKDEVIGRLSIQICDTALNSFVLIYTMSKNLEEL